MAAGSWLSVASFRCLPLRTLQGPARLVGEQRWQARGYAVDEYRFEPPQPSAAAVARRREHSERLAAVLEQHAPHVCILSGAGVSTQSGYPDYRSPKGSYSIGHKPITFQNFLSSLPARQRYWTRAFLGFGRFIKAQPNLSHTSIADLQARHKISTIITQNVDRLLTRAGARDVLELHGNLFEVICLSCRRVIERASFHERFGDANPQLRARQQELLTQWRPDGDVALEDEDYASITIPPCTACGGLLKPNVVFFGESIPPPVVERSFEYVRATQLLLCLGSSLEVFSAFRLVRQAKEQGIPVGIVNIGPTRADQLADFKFEDSTAEFLAAVASWLR